MTQPQLSVRKRAREMFDERFVEMHPMNGQDLHNPPILYQAPPEDIEDFKDFIDQIITLAQEEKIKEVENIMRECQCESCTTDCKGCGEPREYCGGYNGGCDGKSCPRNIALSKVIEILKQ